MAFHIRNCVGIRDDRAFAVQWLACALPCRRFTPALADDGARLRAGVDRYSFTVRDLHPLLLAGLPAHSETLHIFDGIGGSCLPTDFRFAPKADFGAGVTASAYGPGCRQSAVDHDRVAAFAAARAMTGHVADQIRRRRYSSTRPIVAASIRIVISQAMPA